MLRYAALDALPAARSEKHVSQCSAQVNEHVSSVEGERYRSEHFIKAKLKVSWVPPARENPASQ